MREFFKNIIADLKRGSNLDLYLIMIVCLAVAVMSAFGIAKIEWVLAAILTALLIQSANFLSEQRKLDTVISTVALANTPKLVMMNDTDFAVHVKRASQISMISVANFRFLAANAMHFNDFVRRGGRLREILLDPSNQASVRQSAERSVGSSTSPEFTSSQIQLTIDKFKELASHQSSIDQTELRVTSYVTSVVMTWFEFPAEPGLMFITITGFQQTTGTRLTMVLRKDSDISGYQFFATFFDNAWSWVGTRRQ